MGKRAHRAGKFSHPHVFSGAAKARDVALGLGVPVGQLEAKRDGLGVDAVGTADHGRVFEFPGAAFQHVRKLFQIGGDDRRCLLDQQGLGSVDDIVRSQAVVKPAGVGSDDLGHGGGEGDDIVADFSFDLGDAVEVEVSPLANGARQHLWAPCRLRPESPWPRLRPPARCGSDSRRSRCGPCRDGYSVGSPVSPLMFVRNTGLGIVNGCGGW